MTSIRSISATLYRIAPTTPWSDATLDVGSLEFVVVDLHTDGGPEGKGITYTVGAGGKAITTLINEECAPLLIGVPLESPRMISSRLRHHLRRVGLGGITSLAVAGIDIAVWDALAKSRREPLFATLGGESRPLPTYASGIDLHLGPDDLRAHVAGLVAQGYRAVKIKVGRPTLAEDDERVAAARDALGPDRELLLDANEAWTLDEAVRRMAVLEAHRPSWIEEPLHADDIEGHAHLRRRTSVPIALGESLFTPADFLAYLREEAVDILQPDVARIGGITRWLDVARLAETWRRPVAPHYLLELSAQVLTTISNVAYLENVGGGSLFELGLTDFRLDIENGVAWPGQAPGCGLTLKHADIEAAIERRGSVGAATNAFAGE